MKAVDIHILEQLVYDLENCKGSYFELGPAGVDHWITQLAKVITQIQEMSKYANTRHI